MLASCTASENAARNERKARFYAEKKARKNKGKREVVKHKVGDDTKLAKNNKKDKKAAKGKNQGNRSKSGISNHEIEKVIKTARSFIGTPYRDAGTTRIGMDCSGLTMVSYKAIDVDIPRNSVAQSNYGTPVNLNDLQEGDLVFFGMGSNKRRINHVGLVTAVNGKTDVTFIHASTSMGVIENNINSAYYRDRVIKAVRPVTFSGKISQNRLHK